MCNAKNQTEIIVHDRGLFYTLGFLHVQSL